MNRNHIHMAAQITSKQSPASYRSGAKELSEQAESNPPGPVLFDDGETKVVNIREVNGLCEVTYYCADEPSRSLVSLFDEYGIDQQGYLGSFAIQQAVDLFFAEHPPVQSV